MIEKGRGGKEKTAVFPTAGNAPNVPAGVASLASFRCARMFETDIDCLACLIGWWRLVIADVYLMVLEDPIVWSWASSGLCRCAHRKYCLLTRWQSPDTGKLHPDPIRRNKYGTITPDCKDQHVDND